MKHPDYAPDDIQVVLRYIEPEVECFDELAADFFAPRVGNVGVRLEHCLLSAR